MKRSTKLNLIFAAGVLAVAAGLLALRGARPQGMVAVLTYGADSRTMEIPLQQDGRYDVDTGLYVVHLQVEGGRIRFVDSPCPDHLCEGYGWLGQNGDWAACLPAKAAVLVQEAGE